jgi:acyl-CoA reductase-like NAD-dependent aldehyde dehydrogenase
MIQLQSYVRGRWVAGSGDSKTLHDPATEAVLGEVRQGGIDFAEALAHANRTGGPALRAMTFPQRAEALKALSAKLHEHRDELLDIATQNGGNTRGDGKFDLAYWTERYSKSHGNDKYGHWADRAEQALRFLDVRVQAYNDAITVAEEAYKALDGLLVSK